MKYFVTWYNIKTLGLTYFKCHDHINLENMSICTTYSVETINVSVAKLNSITLFVVKIYLTRCTDGLSKRVLERIKCIELQIALVAEKLNDCNLFLALSTDFMGHTLMIIDEH